MTDADNKRGILLMALTMFIFAMQDGISRHLAGEYNVIMIVMIRYWFFAAFVLAISMRDKDGLQKVASTKQPILQLTRGLLLALEICVMVLAFTLLGLIESLAIFAAYPLIVAALSGPILGEYVGPRRWAAIGIGFVGILIILQPGLAVFSPYAFVAICSAALFALYSLLTRYAARLDSTATSFFWTGIVGAISMTMVGIWFWEPMVYRDWLWMAALCVSGAGGHYCLIKVYMIAEASAVQPFAYLQLVFASFIGIFVFHEIVSLNIILGAIIVVGAGVFTLLRAQKATA
ncbi:MAG: DMT family transporter [Litoreibacter sp.]